MRFGYKYRLFYSSFIFFFYFIGEIIEVERSDVI